MKCHTYCLKHVKVSKLINFEEESIDYENVKDKFGVFYNAYLYSMTKGRVFHKLYSHYALLFNLLVKTNSTNSSTVKLK